jgi:ElaB/YqjD/DUF883 family membrane-anchored ribosome-binding protein
MSGDGDNHTDRVRDLREQVKSIERDEVADRKAASTVVSETVDQVAATAEHAARNVNSTYEAAAETIRTHPFAAILCAAATGFILGRALR